MNNTKDFLVTIFLTIFAILVLSLVGIFTYTMFNNAVNVKKLDDVEVQIRKQRLETEKQETAWYEEQREWLDKH